MSDRHTPETDALAEKLIPIAEKITEFNAQSIIKQLLTEILTKTTKLERERDEARAERDILCSNKMSDPLLETTFKHLIRERDEVAENLRILAGLVAYGLGQSGEEWSLEAMRQATDAIQNAKALEGAK